MLKLTFDRNYKSGNDLKIICFEYSMSILEISAIKGNLNHLSSIFSGLNLTVGPKL